MALNPTPNTLNALVTLMYEVEDGANQYGAALPLAQNTKAKITADLIDLDGDPADPVATPGKQSLWVAAKAGKVSKTTLKMIADSNAKVFIADAINVLKSRLGRVWNSNWQTAGFPNNSLAVPVSEDGRFALLGSLKAHFTAHPDHENVPASPTAPMRVTAALAQSLRDALSTARQASNDSNVQAGAAKAARDASFKALQKRHRGVVSELTQLLGETDSRWYGFGLNAPGDPNTPGIPTNLVLTPGAAGSGTMFADWDDARRADRYHVYLLNPDGTRVLLATVSDSDATLTGLTVGQTVTIIVTAVNEAGESLAGAGVSAVVA